jgi:hypothetical protein
VSPSSFLGLGDTFLQRPKENQVPTFEYGQCEGQYFTQWRLDELASLADQIVRVMPEASDFKLWYEPNQDFHHLSFRINGKLFDIRYYKILGLEVDGVDDRWLCQMSYFHSHGLPSLKKLAYPEATP